MRQRTTLTAEADDLETLRAEAQRMGVSLNRVIETLVAKRAAEIQAGKRPRLGLGRSGDAGLSRRSVDDEEAPARTPFRD